MAKSSGSGRPARLTTCVFVMFLFAETSERSTSAALRQRADVWVLTAPQAPPKAESASRPTWCARRDRPAPPAGFCEYCESRRLAHRSDRLTP